MMAGTSSRWSTRSLAGCRTSATSSLGAAHVRVRRRVRRTGVTQLVSDASEQIDEIYHLASPASPKPMARIRGKRLRESVGTMELLDLAAQMGARLLFVSTSEVYGDPLEHPQRETYFGNVNPIGPRECYDEGNASARPRFQ